MKRIEIIAVDSLAARVIDLDFNRGLSRLKAVQGFGKPVDAFVELFDGCAVVGDHFIDKHLICLREILINKIKDYEQNGCRPVLFDDLAENFPLGHRHLLN